MAHVKSVFPIFVMLKTIRWWLSNAPQKHFRHKWSVPNFEIHTCKLERNEFIIIAEMIFVLVLLLNALSKIYYPETLPVINLDKCWKLLVNFALQLSLFSFNDHGKFFFSPILSSSTQFHLGISNANASKVWLFYSYASYI